MRIIHVRKFIPMTVTVGQLTRGVEFEVALNRLDEALNKALSELDGAIGSRVVRQVGISVNNVSLGQVSGILIIAYALVEGDDEASEGGGAGLQGTG